MAKTKPVPRPRFVAIRQTKLAIDCRDHIYRCKARPFGRKCRAWWTRLVAWYVRSRALRYEEVLRIAETLGSDLDANGIELSLANQVDDEVVRREFSKRLTAAARAKGGRTIDGAAYRRELWIARFRAIRHQQLLDGRCPNCCGELPCEPCGYPEVEIDGRGGLRAKR